MASDCWQEKEDVERGTRWTEMDLKGETKKEGKNWERVSPAQTGCYLGWDGGYTQGGVGEA